MGRRGRMQAPQKVVKVWAAVLLQKEDYVDYYYFPISKRFRRISRRWPRPGWSNMGTSTVKTATLCWTSFDHSFGDWMTWCCSFFCTLQSLTMSWCTWPRKNPSIDCLSLQAVVHRNCISGQSDINLLDGLLCNDLLWTDRQTLLWVEGLMERWTMSAEFFLHSYNLPWSWIYQL